jgi:hypothetical protein
VIVARGGHAANSRTIGISEGWTFNALANKFSMTCRSRLTSARNDKFVSLRAYLHRIDALGKVGHCLARECDKIHGPLVQVEQTLVWRGAVSSKSRTSRSKASQRPHKFLGILRIAIVTCTPRTSCQ